MIGMGYLAGGAAIAVTLAGVGGYFTGHSAGVDKERSAELGRLQKQLLGRDRVQAAINEQEQASAAREQGRQSEVRIVYREIPRIVESSPVYRNQCFDDAGLQLLDRAAAAANGGPAPASAGGASGSAQPSTNDRSSDGKGAR